MKSNTWKAYALWIAICESVGILSGLVIRKGIEYYNLAVRKPAYSPPTILFPLVWTVLFALMGIGMARIVLYRKDQKRFSAQNIFIAQLIVNFFWPLIFFNLRAYGAAFMWIILLLFLIVSMILSFRKQDTAAGYLQIPYLFWTAFASILNLSVWILNR